MTRKNDKYALHAKRRIRSNGENFTVSPYAPNKESVYIRDITKSIEKLRSSNDPDDKELLEILIKSKGTKHINKVEQSILKRKGFI